MFFEMFGIDIASARVGVLKSPRHLRASFDEFFADEQIVSVDAPGLTSPMLARFDFKKLPRPVVPLDDIAAWRPRVRSVQPGSAARGTRRPPKPRPRRPCRAFEGCGCHKQNAPRNKKGLLNERYLECATYQAADRPESHLASRAPADPALCREPDGPGECRLCGADNESRTRHDGLAVRVRRRPLLCGLHYRCRAEQPDAGAVRRASLDDAYSRHLGNHCVADRIRG